MSRIYTLGKITTSNESDNQIIYSIVTNNIGEFKRLINKENANKIIDTKNRYTALHYAIQMRNEEMIRYLFQLDAEPSIKNGEGEDAIAMSIRYHCRTLIDSELSEKNTKIKSMQHTINVNNDRVIFLESTIGLQKEQVNDLKTKLNSTNKENSNLKSKNDILASENESLKKVIHEKTLNYEALEKSHTTLKRKYQEQETIIDNLLDGNKKKK